MYVVGFILIPDTVSQWVSRRFCELRVRQPLTVAQLPVTVCHADHPGKHNIERQFVLSKVNCAKDHLSDQLFWPDR